MDDFGQIGPEKGNYEGDAKSAISRLMHEGSLFVKLADRGTRLDLILVWRDKLPHVIGDDNGIGGVPYGARFVGLSVLSGDPTGAYWFSLNHYNEAGYVANKLGAHPVNGEIIAGLLNEMRAQAWGA